MVNTVIKCTFSEMWSVLTLQYMRVPTLIWLEKHIMICATRQLCYHHQENINTTNKHKLHTSYHVFSYSYVHSVDLYFLFVIITTSCNVAILIDVDNPTNIKIKTSNFRWKQKWRYLKKLICTVYRELIANMIHGNYLQNEYMLMKTDAKLEI